jgi:hypothetical protein
MSNVKVRAFFKGQLDALTLVCDQLTSGAPISKTVDAMHAGPPNSSVETTTDWAYQGGYRCIMAAATTLRLLSEKKRR